MFSRDIEINQSLVYEFIDDLGVEGYINLD